MRVRPQSQLFPPILSSSGHIILYTPTDHGDHIERERERDSQQTSLTCPLFFHVSPSPFMMLPTHYTTLRSGGQLHPATLLNVLNTTRQDNEVLVWTVECNIAMRLGVEAASEAASCAFRVF